MYPPITYKLLESKGACAFPLALVKKHFGLDPIPLTMLVADKYGRLFNIDWCVENLLRENDDLWLYRKGIQAATITFEQSLGSTYARKANAAYSRYYKQKARLFVKIYKQSMVRD